MPPYPGGKGAAGVAQRLISLMPPHETYIEPFLGGGTVMRMKKSAKLNIGLDLDEEVISQARDHYLNRAPDDDIPYAFRCCDALSWLVTSRFTGHELVYCDPPYLPSTLRSRPQYKYMLSEEQHIKLLSILRTLPCMVMLSGYWSQLYVDTLHDWLHTSYQVITRGGTLATEYLWANYILPPSSLHDYRFVGQNFRERERFTRQQRRWIKRLEAMSPLQRQALLAALDAVPPRCLAPPGDAARSMAPLAGPGDAVLPVPPRHAQR